MQILDNGIQFDNGDIEFFWFKLLLNSGRQIYRAAAFEELVVISVDKQEPEDWNLLGKQQAALRGLYNANVDFIFSASGIFRPRHIGVVQYYGAAGNGDTLEEAGEKATDGLEGVLSALLNNQQSRTRPPQKKWIEWCKHFLLRFLRTLLPQLIFCRRLTLP